MKRIYKSALRFAVILIITSTTFSCTEKAKERTAADMLAQIRMDFEAGRDSVVIDSIRSLRQQFPNAVAERKECLKLFQDASLRLSQNDLARTDSALEATKREHERLQREIASKYPDGNAPASILNAVSKARVTRDSLQNRFDVLCSQVRYIHKRQKQE